jgi:hypothetical protein
VHLLEGVEVGPRRVEIAVNGGVENGVVRRSPGSIDEGAGRFPERDAAGQA